MNSSTRGGDDNWLRDFIAGTVDEPRPDGSDTGEPALPPAWMELIGEPTPGESIGPIGPYRIDQRIGHGGMGVVLKAFDERLQRVVAVKVLRPAPGRQRHGPPALRPRGPSRRRGQPRPRRRHPRRRRRRARPYLVMEFIDGPSLEDQLNGTGRRRSEGVLRIGLQIAAGPGRRPQTGLVHRDIKPANILLDNGVGASRSPTSAWPARSMTPA